MHMSLTQTYPAVMGTRTYDDLKAISASHNSTEQFSRPEPRVAETPAKSSSKLAWTGSDLNPSVYIVSLNDEDRSSIANAVRDYKGTAEIPSNSKRTDH